MLAKKYFTHLLQVFLQVFFFHLFPFMASCKCSHPSSFFILVIGRYRMLVGACASRKTIRGILYLTLQTQSHTNLFEKTTNLHQKILLIILLTLLACVCHILCSNHVIINNIYFGF
ncbi:hypothetical protein AAZV13_10G163900 [Glycine max]